MATSGSTNFTQTRDQVILDALQLIGVYGIGRTVSADDMAFAVSILNKMVKAWATKGLHLWSKEEGVLYLTPNVGSYTLSNASTSAYVTTASDQVITQLSVDAATSDTSLTVTSTTNMTVGDYIGVVLDTGSIHWTTIATIPSSTTLTLTLALVSAAASSNLVYTFTNRAAKPLRILSSRYVTGIDLTTSSTLVELPMTSVGYEEYQDIPVKTSSGICNQFNYNPKVDSGTMYLWPRPSTGAARIHFTFERIIEDLDNTGDNFDFPGEWLEPLTFQLAARLCLPFGRSKKLAEISPIASVMLNDLLSWDTEITSVRITPDLRDY